jgi:hypothetical protein
MIPAIYLWHVLGDFGQNRLRFKCSQLKPQNIVMELNNVMLSQIEIFQFSIIHLKSKYSIDASNEMNGVDLKVREAKRPMGLK